MKPFLCYFGIHIYKDYFHIDKMVGTTLPFTTVHKCKCDKVKYRAVGTIELPVSDQMLDRRLIENRIRKETKDG